jgi:nitrogen-specific signal transduction histidine kinase/ActR/RegA family two-component response regulator
LLEDGGMIGTARDITGRVKAEQEKKRLEQQFYQAQKMEAVGRLVGGIAHDFNNLLASMMGYADFLMDDLDPDSKSYRFARSIYEGGIQAREVIDRLLTFSRTQDHEVKCIDAYELIDNAINLIRPGLGTHIAIHFNNGDHAVLSGDHTLISQAIMNLLVNARDAIGDGRGDISVFLRARRFFARDHLDGVLSGGLAEGAECVEISVADTGCGIEREIITHIFDPFYTTKPADQGTGLGLASVHGIMQAHKGAVYVTSVPGKGSEFRLYFPICPEDKIRRLVNQCAAMPDFAGPSLIGVHIMLVDDMDDVREMLKIMLERQGGIVDSCSSAGQAQKILESGDRHYDLVVTDQTMPEMSGLDLARWIESQNLNIPVILVSGYTQENINRQGNAQDCVVAMVKKPVDRAQLFDAIDRCLKLSAAPLPPPTCNQQEQKAGQA